MKSYQTLIKGQPTTDSVMQVWMAWEVKAISQDLVALVI